MFFIYVPYSPSLLIVIIKFEVMIASDKLPQYESNILLSSFLDNIRNFRYGQEKRKYILT